MTNDGSTKEEPMTRWEWVVEDAGRRRVGRDRWPLSLATPDRIRHARPASGHSSLVIRHSFMLLSFVIHHSFVLPSFIIRHSFMLLSFIIRHSLVLPSFVIHHSFVLPSFVIRHSLVLPSFVIRHSLFPCAPPCTVH